MGEFSWEQNVGKYMRELPEGKAMIICDEIPCSFVPNLHLLHDEYSCEAFEAVFGANATETRTAIFGIVL